MKTTKTTRITAPAGMSGLWVAPWGETYAVAADWSAATAPVMFYGKSGWGHDVLGRQVADFRHYPDAALAAALWDALGDEGDEGDDCVVAAAVAAAHDLVSVELDAMATMLEQYGEVFAGHGTWRTLAIAQEWLDADFDADEAGDWCAIGCWEPEAAEEWRDAGKTPDQIAAAAEEMAADGDMIYDVCNGDRSARVLMDATE